MTCSRVTTTCAFTLGTGPAGMQAPDGSGRVTWSPTSADVGTLAVTLRVSDGRGGSAEQAYVVRVVEGLPNRPPRFTPDPVADASVNTDYVYPATAADPDLDPLGFTVDAGPDGVTILDPATGRVTWRPTADQLGLHAVTLQVDDGRGGTATQTYTINVHPQPGNHPPLITSPPITTALIEDPYAYLVTALDPDGDPLRYTLDVAPAGLTIDPPTGRISWPQPQTGVVPVTVRVRDGRGGEDVQSFEICVSTRSGLLILGSGGGTDAFSPLDTTDFDLLLRTAQERSFPNPFVPAPIGAFGTFTPPVNDHPVVSSEPLYQSGFYRRVFGLPCDVVTPRLRIVANTDDLGSVFLNGRLLGAPWSLDQFGFGSGASSDRFTSVETSDPTRLHPGDNELLFVVNNNGGGPTGTSYEATITLGDVNRPPAIDSEPVERANVGWPYEYRVRASDPDGDPLSYSLSPGAPAGVQIDASGRITWTPSAAASPQPVAVRVTDPRGLSAEQGFTVTVGDGAGNAAPVLQNRPGFAAGVGVRFTFDAHATDADGDPVRFALAVAPEGMVLDPETGALRWVPTADQVGPHDLLLVVRDGRGGVATADFVVTVSAVNVAPEITSQPVGRTVVADRPYRYQVLAQDDDGDVITYGLTPGLTGLAIDPATGLLSWTAPASLEGPHRIVVTAGDGRLTTSQEFEWTVVLDGVNHPPEVRAPARGTIRAGLTYLAAIAAVDPDGDPLTYRALDPLPAGMELRPDGIVTWTPAIEQVRAEDYAVQIEVDDGRGETALVTLRLAVTLGFANAAPAIDSTPPTAGVVGQPYAYDVRASDPDHDVLSYSLDAAPHGLSIHPETGTVRWAPTVDQIGTHEVTVRVRDPYGHAALQTFTVVVRGINSPPRFDSIPTTALAPGASDAYAAHAVDPDGDAIAYRLAPEAQPLEDLGLRLDPETGRLTWDNVPAGTYRIALDADDRHGAIARQTYTLVVSAALANHPPTITSTPAFVATVGQPYQYQVTATDPDGEAPRFELVDNPDPTRMRLDVSTGLLEWIPAADGPATVVVRAVDAAGAATFQRFTIVARTNHRPQLGPDRVDSIVAGRTYRVDVPATDADGDPLTYALNGAPAGMTIDALGRIIWATDRSLVAGSPYVFRILARDDRGAAADPQTVTLRVVPDTTAPVLDIRLGATEVDPGGAVTILVLATDDVDVTERILTVGGRDVVLDARGAATVPAGSTPSVVPIVATARDTAGNEGRKETSFRVRNPNAQAPTVTIDSPIDDPATAADETIITAPTTVMISLADPDGNLASYVLEAVPLTGGPSTVIAAVTSGATPLDHQIVGTCDPTILANGSYLIRLSATTPTG